MRRVQRALVTATTALAVIAASAAASAAPAGGRTERTGLQKQLDDIVSTGAVGALMEVRDEHGVCRVPAGSVCSPARRSRWWPY